MGGGGEEGGVEGVGEEEKEEEEDQEDGFMEEAEGEARTLHGIEWVGRRLRS